MRELTKGELNSEIDRYFADARTNIGYAQASLKEGLDDPLDLEDAVVHVVNAEAALAVAYTLMHVSVIAGLGPVSRGRGATIRCNPVFDPC